MQQQLAFILVPSVDGHTVDGRNPAPVDTVGSLSHYLQGFIHPRWCRISEPSTVGFTKELVPRCKKIEMWLTSAGVECVAAS